MDSSRASPIKGFMDRFSPSKPRPVPHPPNHRRSHSMGSAVTGSKSILKSLLHKASKSQLLGDGNKKGDVKRLSQKVSNLEAELRDARRKLNQASRRGSVNWDKVTFMEEPDSFGAQYDGFVENLLLQGHTDRSMRKASRSADDLRRVLNSERSPESLKRKREDRAVSLDKLQAESDDHRDLRPRKTRRASRDKVLMNKELPAIREVSRVLPVPVETLKLEQHESKSSLEAPGLDQSLLPKKSRHRRRQSIVILREDADAAVEAAQDDKRKRLRARADSNNANRALAVTDSNWERVGAAPPSPSRKGNPSPSRLTRVEEEFEWDEEVF